MVADAGCGCFVSGQAGLLDRWIDVFE